MKARYFRVTDSPRTLVHVNTNQGDVKAMTKLSPDDADDEELGIKVALLRAAYKAYIMGYVLIDVEDDRANVSFGLGSLNRAVVAYAKAVAKNEVKAAEWCWEKRTGANRRNAISAFHIAKMIDIEITLLYRLETLIVDAMINPDIPRMSVEALHEDNRFTEWMSRELKDLMRAEVLCIGKKDGVTRWVGYIAAIDRFIYSDGLTDFKMGLLRKPLVAFLGGCQSGIYDIIMAILEE